MVEPEAILRDSPVDFDSAVAYALHPQMRRLILLYIVGVILLPVGIDIYVGGPPGVTVPALLMNLLGIALIIIGATFLFAGLVGATFKLVTDANILANATETTS